MTDKKIDASAYASPESIRNLSDQLDLGHLSGSFSDESIAEVLRVLGQTGVLATRQYLTNLAYKPKSRVIDTNSLGALALHDHPNYRAMSGLGEFVAIVNGHPYRTRHNDYIIRKSIIGNSDEYAAETIEMPELKASISAKPTGVVGDSVDAVSDTQAKYLKEIHASSPEDVDAYLAGGEFWWEIVDESELTDAGLSFRHADSVFDLHARFAGNNYYTTTGLTDRLENRSMTPIIKSGIDANAKPVYLVMQYRITTTKIGTFAKKGTNVQPPIITIGTTNHNHVLNTQLTKAQADDLRSGAQTTVTLTSTDSGHTHNYEITWNGTRFIGVDTNVTHQHYVLIEEGFTGEIPYDKVKAAAGIIDSDNVFTHESDDAVNSIFNLSDAECIDSTKARFSVDQLDRMVERVPGLDGEGSFIDERDIDEVLAAEVGANPIIDRDGGTLNSAYYHKNYSIPVANAAGRSSTARGYNDTNLFVARNTKTNCYQNVSYFVPLEILAITPEMSWNPYQIAFDTYESFAGGARGNGTEGNPYTAYSEKEYFYITPAGLYSQSGEPDPADTSSNEWILSGIDSQPRLCSPSGIKAFTPDRVHRLRFPVFSRYQDGSMEGRDLLYMKDKVNELRSDIETLNTSVSNAIGNISQLYTDVSSVRKTLVVSESKTLSVSDFVNGTYDFTARLALSDVTLLVPSDIPDLYKIKASVMLQDGTKKLTLVVGDGTVEKFRSNRGYVEAGGNFELSEEGAAEFQKQGAFWQQLSKFTYSMPMATTLPASVNATDPYVIRLQMGEVTNGTGPFTAYKYTMTMLDQGSRVVTIGGNVLTGSPTIVTDTAGIVTSSKTGPFIGVSGTVIGGIARTRNSTINALRGTQNNINLVSSICDFYGNIKIVVSVTDGNSDVISREL